MRKIRDRVWVLAAVVSWFAAGALVAGCTDTMTDPPVQPPAAPPVASAQPHLTYYYIPG